MCAKVRVSRRAWESHDVSTKRARETQQGSRSGLEEASHPLPKLKTGSLLHVVTACATPIADGTSYACGPGYGSEPPAVPLLHRGERETLPNFQMGGSCLRPSGCFAPMLGGNS